MLRNFTFVFVLCAAMLACAPAILAQTGPSAPAPAAPTLVTVQVMSRNDAAVTLARPVTFMPGTVVLKKWSLNKNIVEVGGITFPSSHEFDAGYRFTKPIFAPAGIKIEAESFAISAGTVLPDTMLLTPVRDVAGTFATGALNAAQLDIVTQNQGVQIQNVAAQASAAQQVAASAQQAATSATTTSSAVLKELTGLKTDVSTLKAGQTNLLESTKRLENTQKIHGEKLDTLQRDVVGLKTDVAALKSSQPTVATSVLMQYEYGTDIHGCRIRRLVGGTVWERY